MADYKTADEARSAMESARSSVMEAEKSIQSIKTALRELGAGTSAVEGTDAGGNSLKVTATKIVGLPENAAPSLEVQLSSPIESITLGMNEEGTFAGVEVDAAMLTVSAKDAEIELGHSTSYDVKPLCGIDVLGGVKKKVTELEVAIVADEAESAAVDGDGKTEEDDKDEGKEEVAPASSSLDESVYHDATDLPVDDASPRPVVFCGPSGVGKGTLIDLLMKKYPQAFGFSVSHTTRAPRDGEEDGVHYNFTTVEQIEKEIEQEKFIEYAEVHGRYYGTSIAAVETVQSSGKICILDIDVQGVRSVKSSSLEPIYVFIAPPSMEALESRLRGRGTEKEEDVVKRLANAKAELDYGLEEGNFDKVFTNDDLDKTFEELVEAFEGWYPHLSKAGGDDAGEKEEEKKEVDSAPSLVTPICTVTLRVEYEPSKKDIKDELYVQLNSASKEKAAAIDKLRKSAAAVSRLSAKESPTKSSSEDGNSRAVKAGFLNKKMKEEEPGPIRRFYEKTIGPNSLVRMLFPVAKNYLIFFGAAVFMHFQGHQLALPPPV